MIIKIYFRYINYSNQLLYCSRKDNNFLKRFFLEKQISFSLQPINLTKHQWSFKQQAHPIFWETQLLEKSLVNALFILPKKRGFKGMAFRNKYIKTFFSIFSKFSKFSFFFIFFELCWTGNNLPFLCISNKLGINRLFCAILTNFFLYLFHPTPDQKGVQKGRTSLIFKNKNNLKANRKWKFNNTFPFFFPFLQ